MHAPREPSARSCARRRMAQPGPATSAPSPWCLLRIFWKCSKSPNSPRFCLGKRGAGSAPAGGNVVVLVWRHSTGCSHPPKIFPCYLHQSGCQGEALLESPLCTKKKKQLKTSPPPETEGWHQDRAKSLSPPRAS